MYLAVYDCYFIKRTVYIDFEVPNNQRKNIVEELGTKI